MILLLICIIGACTLFGGLRAYREAELEIRATTMYEIGGGMALGLIIGIIAATLTVLVAAWFGVLGS